MGSLAGNTENLKTVAIHKPYCTHTNRNSGMPRHHGEGRLQMNRAPSLVTSHKGGHSTKHLILISNHQHARGLPYPLYGWETIEFYTPCLRSNSYSDPARLFLSCHLQWHTPEPLRTVLQSSSPSTSSRGDRGLETGLFSSLPCPEHSASAQGFSFLVQLKPTSSGMPSLGTSACCQSTAPPTFLFEHLRFVSVYIYMSCLPRAPNTEGTRN